MGHIDIAKASIEDCYYIFGNRSYKPKDIIKKFLSYGSEIVIITLDREGSMIETKSNFYNINAIDTKVIDGTGAGDTFTSGFLSEYLVSQDIKWVGIFATATALLLMKEPEVLVLTEPLLGTWYWKG